jgi:ribosomal protein S18 acetylase RimI-like enzyme
MAHVEFDTFLERTIADYAAEQAAAYGWSPDEALRIASGELARLLPDGLNTPDQHLLILTDDATGMPIGTLWIGVQRRGDTLDAYIGQLEIDAAHRRRGLGREAMLAAEREAKALGCTTMSLHVFARNAAAQSLYRSLGFGVTGLLMAKGLT